MNQDEILAYYTHQGPMTEPGEFAGPLEVFPADPVGIARTVQGLMLHVFWAERYGQNLSEERSAEVQLRSLRRMLTRALEIDSQPLDSPRPLDRKLVGNCRHFTVLSVAALRSKGIPARSRCGFGTYFTPDSYVDHWVYEYWDDARGRWVMADSQLDAFQRDVLKTDFDTLDMPEGAFITGGKAWLMARREGTDPQKFGIFDMRGLDFIKGNVIRDLAALNRFEALPWDIWGWIEKPAAEMSEGELVRLDEAAEVCADSDISAAREIYEREPLFQAPLSLVD